MHASTPSVHDNKLDNKIGVLFICLGNICRSPSAQGIMEHLVKEDGLSDKIHVDSCGTAPFNVGKSPDPRALNACEKYGYDITTQIARQIHDDDFTHYKYIMVMDRKNKMSVDAWTPKDFEGEVRLLMEFNPVKTGNNQIPDPYHEGAEAFYPIIETIEKTTRGLLDYIKEKESL